MENVFVFILLTAAFLQAIFYLLIFTPILLTQRVTKRDNDANLNNFDVIPLSVIICAKDEKDNLINHLPKIFKQHYSNFEVIVVDDGSEDGTKEVLEDCLKKFSNLQVVYLDPKIKKGFGKKEALSLGIQHANNEWLVMIDADCYPASDNWLYYLAQKMSEDKSMILGVGLYEKKWSLLNMLIRYETILVALQYLNFCELGLPYMGVGRNIAYRKSLFLANNGFENHKEISSGDDDLFVNAVATKKNCDYCFYNDAFTYSLAPRSWKEWIIQKGRHYSTGKKYKFIHQLILSLFLGSKWLFWVIPICLLVFGIWNESVHRAISGTFFVYYAIMAWATHRFKEKEFWLLTPLLDFLFIITIIPLGIKSTFFSKNKWA